MAKETFIATNEDIKAMLKEIANNEQRTMKTVLARLVKDEYAKQKHK